MDRKRQIQRYGRSAFLWAWVVLTGCQACEERQAEEPEPTEDQLVIGRLDAMLSAFDSDGQPMELDVSIDEILRSELSKSATLLLREAEGGPVASSFRRSKLKVSAKVVVDGFTKDLHALVDARITKTGAIPLDVSLDLVKESPSQGEAFSREDYEKHLDTAARQAISALDEQAKLLKSGNSILIEALGNERAAVKVAAARTLGRRKASEAVAPLCGMLDHESFQVSQSAIGALALIEDERATPCLIEWADMEERKLAIILEPLVAIGGREARAFVEMVASGHESEGLKRAYEEGLKRMKVPAGPRSAEPSRDGGRDDASIEPSRDE